MKSLSIVFQAFCYLLVSTSGIRAERLESRKPNVVIFFTDDQGTLDANCYGSEDLHTPTMDKLAETGVRFTQAYGHTVCCPSRAMLMTGRYPQRGNVRAWTQANAKGEKGRNMFREEVTLAEVLGDAGYSTGLFGKWHLGADFEHGPTEQGFDEFFGLRGGFIDNYKHFALHGSGFHDLYDGKKEVFAEGKYFPDLITERALEFIGKSDGKPFFLYMAFNVPHYPEQADAKFDELYEDMAMPRRSYAKMISTTDDRMGRILNRLESEGLRENTIVVFMSDNGHSVEDYRIKVNDHNSGLEKGVNYGANGGGGNTGKWKGAKATFFEGGIRVPAIISYPAVLPGGVVRDQAITAMDWMPTILELCDVERPEKVFDGKSLVECIEADPEKALHQVMHWEWRNAWAVREGDWKLMGLGEKVTFLGNLGDEEPEQINYLSEEPGMAKRLEKLHREWLKEVVPALE